MELIVRAVDPDRNSRELIVDVEPTHTVAELTEALATHLGIGTMSSGLVVDRTGAHLDPADEVGEVDLVSGDEVRVGPPIVHTAPTVPPRRAVVADVLAGPESGRSLVMRPGEYSVGRSVDADLVIDDPSVSRHHLDVSVDDDWSVVANPAPDVPNGVTVNDVPTDEPTTLEAGDVVGLGGSRVTFRTYERRLDEHIDRLGQIDFHRTPYRPPVVTERDDQKLGPIPERPEPRRLQILAVLAPLAAGLAMFAFTRQPQFLALTAISPIVMIANVVEDRRSGRKRFRDDLQAFRDRLSAHRGRLEQLRHEERVERLKSAPDLADLSRRAQLRTVDLWARGRDAPDFLRLRVGLGAAAVGYGIELDRGGADDLRDELTEAVAGLDDLDNVPVTVDLVADPVFGLHGERQLVDGAATSLVIQAATMHSPEDLTIVSAVSSDRPFGWLKWLPHVRSVASPLPGNHVVSDQAAASSVVSRLVEVAEFRSGDGRRDDTRRSWPRILLLLDGELAPDAVEVSRLLDADPAAGISVIWLAGAVAGIPRQAANVLAASSGQGAAMIGHLWSTDPEVPDQMLEIEHLRTSRADLTARALAPVRDASTASLATSIPRRAPLLDVLGVGKPTGQWITERWLNATDYDLRFPIGFHADGPLEIDLVHDGPHTLIGGTSGAGKSELLQSMVAALAAGHPPTRLNFLFVDYKGGASSKVFERLPHTVGYVTNLSADLSLRALTSLRAELNRRMAVMEGRAKDLEEMLEVAPQDAPPSLVIIVDEFATLVKEVPEFVAGVIDIAQRGRSLGIHLVLATQRPSGSVNENILANTNLRMSLRMLDRTESSSVIDSPEAADIPVPLRGRGFVRLGPRQLVEFQSSFAGAPLVTGEERQPVLVAPYERTDDSARAVAVGGGRDEPTETHLSAIIDAIVDANDSLQLPSPRRPWREVLPELIPLDNMVQPDEHGGIAALVEHPGRDVVIGLLDAPETQDQRPAVIDLETGGGLLAFGSGGSGKTTLLRTIAASISASNRAEEVAILAFDFASRGLANIKPLPDVIDVATGDDLEAVTRHLSMLDDELTRRRRLLADAENLTAYNRLGAPLPRIVVLIDGFGAMASTFITGTGAAAAAMERWGELILRIVIDGRQAGIHTVLTADRHNAVPSRLHSAIANRLIFSHADIQGYSDHGINGERARQLDLPAGRGLLQAQTLVQVACVSPDDGSARGQGDRIAALADQHGRERTDVLLSAQLPESIGLDQIDKGRGEVLRPCLGVADVSGEPVIVDLEWSNLVVAGPPRSGRSTALMTAARSMVADHDVWAVGSVSSPVDDLDGVEVAVGRPAELAEHLERLADLLAMGQTSRRQVLIVDDADVLDDMAIAPVLERLAASDELRIVAALEARALTGYSQSPLVNALRRARRMLVLRPDDPERVRCDDRDQAHGPARHRPATGPRHPARRPRADGHAGRDAVTGGRRLESDVRRTSGTRPWGRVRVGRPERPPT